MANVLGAYAGMDPSVRWDDGVVGERLLQCQQGDADPGESEVMADVLGACAGMDLSVRWGDGVGWDDVVCLGDS